MNIKNGGKTKMKTKTKIKHIKLAWACDNCNYLTISDSKEHHKMDTCPCGECGVVTRLRDKLGSQKPTNAN